MDSPITHPPACLDCLFIQFLENLPPPTITPSYYNYQELNSVCFFALINLLRNIINFRSFYTLLPSSSSRKFVYISSQSLNHVQMLFLWKRMLRLRLVTEVLLLCLNFSFRHSGSIRSK